MKRPIRSWITIPNHDSASDTAYELLLRKISALSHLINVGNNCFHYPSGRPQNAHHIRLYIQIPAFKKRNYSSTPSRNCWMRGRDWWLRLKVKSTLWYREYEDAQADSGCSGLEAGMEQEEFILRWTYWIEFTMHTGLSALTGLNTVDLRRPFFAN